METSTIFISFDHDHDRRHWCSLQDLSVAPDADIAFDCLALEDFDLSSVSRIKEIVGGKIQAASQVLVVVGQHANRYHGDHEQIGTRNWQWWDIEEADRAGKPFLAVRIDPRNAVPNPLFGKHPVWVNDFTMDAIRTAVRETLVRSGR